MDSNAAARRQMVGRARTVLAVKRWQGRAESEGQPGGRRVRRAATAGTRICKQQPLTALRNDLAASSRWTANCSLQPHLAINMESGSAQIGDRVSFRISDVYLPEPSEVLTHLTTDVEANGVIVEFSDSGTSLQAYAVVRLTAMQSVLLPVTALRAAS